MQKVEFKNLSIAKSHFGTLILPNFGSKYPCKKTPHVLGQELAKIQLTKVSKDSFGDFVSPVCQYLHSYVSGGFFYEIPDFLHKNGNFEENRQFQYLTASILLPILLFPVNMCILPGKIDEE